MTSLNNWGLKFIRWGMGLGILGLITGYFPLGHYLMKDSLPSCPAAPVHGHVILLSFIGMSVCGLIYRALPDWLRPGESPTRLARIHFWLAVIGIVGVLLNGTIGYELLGMFGKQHFYYIGPEGQAVRNLWFGIDGLFLTIYGAGCAILFYIVATKTKYSD